MCSLALRPPAIIHCQARTYIYMALRPCNFQYDYSQNEKKTKYDNLHTAIVEIYEV